MKRLKTAFFFGFKNKNNKRELNNRIKETRNKGNLILESRGHKVKSKKESTIKELLKWTKFWQLHFRNVIKSMRGDLGTLGVILGAIKWGWGNWVF